jgi:hypothetical protein
MKKVGFTGTRFGMTDKQKETVARLLDKIGGTFFHHGDCVGADEEAAGIAGLLGYKLICHPPIKDEHRAYTKGNDYVLKPKSHFARNRDIVDETDILIGCPQYDEPITKQTMGGTAYTVNYSRKQSKPSIVVSPDGVARAERAVAEWIGLGVFEYGL